MRKITVESLGICCACAYFAIYRELMAAGDWHTWIRHEPCRSKIAAARKIIFGKRA